MRALSEILEGEEYDVFIMKGAISPIYWISHVFGYKLKPFHKDWLNLISKNRFLNITSFRGSGKTALLAIAYPLWLAWYKHNQDFLIVSSSYKHSLRIMSLIKEEIRENELLNQLRPDDRKTWKADEIITNTKSKIYCRAYNENIAGVRTDYVLCDEASKFVDNNIFHRIIEPTADLRKGTIVTIGTPESNVDLLSELSTNSSYTSQTIKIIEDGKSTWPEKYSVKEIKNIRQRIGEHAFQSEYLCNPQAQAENALYPADVLSECFDI